MGIDYSPEKVTTGKSRSISSELIVVISLMIFMSSFILNGSASIPFPPGIEPGMSCNANGLTGVYERVLLNENHPEWGTMPHCRIDRWVLKSFSRTGSETPVIAGSMITLKFGEDNRLRGDGTISGSSGCYRYWGGYQAVGGKIAFNDIYTTYKSCLDNRIMQQEERYTNALQTAKRFDLKGNRLTITCDGDVLNFAR